MEQEQPRSIGIIIGGILVVAILAISGFLILRNQTYQALKQAANTVPTSTPFPSQIQQATPTISYQGVNGTDALTLLKKQAPVEQDTSGMVVAINGIRANSAEHEYWAFYVNGKLSDVGPSDYKTKDTDTIEWKIQKY